MAHEIEEIDVQVGIEMGWHRLTRVKPLINKDNCEIIYPMSKQQLALPNGQLTDFYAIVCDDIGRAVGSAVGKEYTLIDNGQIWDMTDKALAGTKHQIVSCGTVTNRSKGFISIKLDENFTAANRNTESVLNIIWGHGGKCAVLARTGITVVVCANTLNQALSRRGDFNFSVRHTGSALPRLEGMSKAIDAHCGVVSEFKAAMETFSKQSCPVSTAREVLTGFIVREEKEKVSTRAGNQIDELVSLFRYGNGNKGQDMSDLFNAATDYYTHKSSGGENRYKQFESSEFGMGARRKQEMFELLKGDYVRDLGDFEEVKTRGNKVLQLM